MTFDEVMVHFFGQHYKKGLTQADIEISEAIYKEGYKKGWTDSAEGIFLDSETLTPQD